MISEFTDKINRFFGVTSLNEENPSTSNKASERTQEETLNMASKVEDRISQSVGSRVVHCGSGNNDGVTRGKSSVFAQNQRKRYSKKPESLEIEIATLDLPENEVVSFGAEDTVFTVKGGLIEGEVTLKEIADAINYCARKDEADETAEIFAKMRYSRRRSSVLRDRELEAAAAALGDRMI